MTAWKVVGLFLLIGYSIFGAIVTLMFVGGLVVAGFMIASLIVG